MATFKWYSVKRFLKTGTIFVLVICSLCLVFLIQSAQIYNGLNSADLEKPGRKGHVVPLRTFTQSLVMSGGDDIPSSPPWTLAPVTIYTEPEEFEQFYANGTNSQTRYLTTKFFMSPGLGNQMFQYAALVALASRHNATVVVPEGALIRRAFTLPNTVFVSNRLSMHLLKNWNRRFFVQCCRYYPESEELQNATRFALYGYFQSYKYFAAEETQELVRSRFSFLPEIQNAALGYLRKSKENHVAKNRKSHLEVDQLQLIGVHVRRGLDITWNSRNQQHGHTVASKSYFFKAMDYFRKKFQGNVLFIVCTDDFYWVKQTFANEADVQIINSRIREVDLCVLTMCNHTIMSQGTFSWWAAFLAGGQTVYYDGWPRPGSMLDAMTKKKDFFLPAWIPML